MTTIVEALRECLAVQTVGTSSTRFARAWANARAALAEHDAQPAAEPMREGEVMGAYIDFDRTADKAWASAEYLTRFGMFVSERTLTQQTPRSMTMTIDATEIGAKLASELLELGKERTPAHRIEFKGGTWPHNEIPQGGMNESSLARFFAQKLTEYLGPNVRAKRETP